MNGEIAVQFSVPSFGQDPHHACSGFERGTDAHRVPSSRPLRGVMHRNIGVTVFWPAGTARNIMPPI